MMAVSFTLRRLATVGPTIYSKHVSAINYMVCRNFSRQLKINWVRPPNVPFYEPSVTGDLASFQMPDKDTFVENFDSCELLKTVANDNVKKIFAMSNQSLQIRYHTYKMGLVNKVKDHEHDFFSLPVKIAALTAKIRFMCYVMSKKKSNKKYRKPLNMILHKRRRFLKYLRNLDYKKFEWVLEQLDLKFYPVPIVKEAVTKKKSTRLLAEYRKEKHKELKRAEYKEKLDLEKIPFLEKKLKTLQHIKEQERMYHLESTVTDTDIENCVQQIEKVKIQVEENKKRGYVRKIHPYTLEIYNPIIKKSDIN